MSTSTIQHIIAMPIDIADAGESAFQGFSLGLFPDYLTIMAALIVFPHDMLELGLADKRLVGSRMAGANLNIRMVRVDLIDADHVELQNFPTVIWSSPKSVGQVSARLPQFRFRPLHLTLGEHEDAVSITGLTTGDTYRLLLELAERAAAAEVEFQELVQAMRALPPVGRKKGRLNFIPRIHNSSEPVAQLLRIYGYELDNAERIEACPDNSPYIAAMLEMAQVIDALRRDQPQEVVLMRKNDAIIFCPSIYAFKYRFNQWNPILRNLNKAKRHFVKNLLVRNKGYSNSMVEIEGAVFNPYEDPVIGPMLFHRQLELRYFTALIAVLAANQFVSALRLPHAVMLHHDMLSEIYALVNSSKANRVEELSRRLGEYGDAIRDEMGQDLWAAAFDDRERLLLICDFPAEWLPVKLVPAMFRYELSRIPSTPGNVTAHVMLNGPRTTVPCSMLQKVLVIRSFDPNDPIRDHLATCLARYPLKTVRVEIVDVTTTAEVVAAMNSFDGAVLVFDCHGNHGGKTEHAWLHIGKERVDVWQLRLVARMTPIVLLAACSTHPLDGSHASVANGFLSSGVLAVLGTHAPVQSVHAAILVARLIYRVEAFVPLITRHRPSTWREVVSGFLRMSYVTDILHDQLSRNHITEDQYRRIHLNANEAINSSAPTWVDGLQRELAEATGQSDAEIKVLWAKRYQFVETMLFTQLGRPENIIILSDDAYFLGTSVDVSTTSAKPVADIEIV